MRTTAHPCRSALSPRPRLACVPLLLAVTLAGCQALAPEKPSITTQAAPAAALETTADVPPPGAHARLGAPEGSIARIVFQAETQPQEPETELPRIGPPVVPAPIQVKQLDLCMALEQAGVASPIIALAVEQVRASEAMRLLADAMLLPSLRGGMNAHIHQGTLLSSFGIVRQVNLQSVYAGAGAGAKVAESIAIPGIQIYAQLAQAYYAPQAAQQQVLARRFDSVAVRNQTLLEVGTAYLALSAAQATLQAFQRSEEDVNTIVTMTKDFSETGFGLESDAQRARTVWLLLEQQTEEAQADIAVAAAQLARLLNLDPSMRLVATDVVPPLLDIVDPATPLPRLLEAALVNHPELGARSADVATAQIQVRQERVRPWLPLISLAFSSGSMAGTGTQSGNQPWTMGGRIDVDLMASWSLQNLGFGNNALQNRARASVGIAEAERLRAVNRIRDEVAAAYNLALARRREVEIARRRITTAQKAFEQDRTRVRNGVGRPIEVVRSVELIIAARQDLIRAMAGYSEAQLQLFVALGQTPRCAPPVPPGGTVPPDCRPNA